MIERRPHIGVSCTTRRIVVAAVLACVVALVAVVGASADASIEEKRAQAQAIIAEIERIDEEVGAAAERWNGATLELGRLEQELKSARHYLGIARDSYTVAQGRASTLLRELYMNGERVSAIEVMLGAESLGDVLDKLDLSQRVANQDSRIVRNADDLRKRIAKQESRLESATERQAVVVDQRAADKRAIEAQLAERQRLLVSVKDEIARMEEAERRRQAELRRQAQLELERQQRLAEQQRAAEQRRLAEQQEAARERARQAASPDPAPALVEAFQPAAVGDADGDGLGSTAPSVVYEPPPADASRGAQVVAIAMQYLGIPYLWGASDPSVGFDCSGLTTYVFAKIGVSLPHYAAAQYGYGSPVSRDQLQAGDLVFFRGLGHMGMYIGGGNFIHAPRTGDVVKISSLSDDYYVRNWVGARRVL